MKRVLALVLAVVLAFGMTTVAFAASADRITGFKDSTIGISGYTCFDSFNTSSPWDPDNTDVVHNQTYRIYLDPEQFEWDQNKGNKGVASTETMNLSNVSGLSVRATWTKGGSFLNAPELKYASPSGSGANAQPGRVYVELKAKKGITATSDTEVAGKITITYKSERAELAISGQTKNTAGDPKIGKDDEAIWLKKSNYIDCGEFVKALEVNFDDTDDVIAYLNVFGGKKYYIWIEEDVQTKDEEILAKYDSIEAVYHAYYSNNVNVPSTYIQFDVDEKYYVYDAEGKYIGLTTDKQLPLSTVYYLSSKEIDDLGGETEEPGEAPTAETPEDPANPETGGDNAPANANDNPGTGADGLVSLAVAAGLVALAVAGISKK